MKLIHKFTQKLNAYSMEDLVIGRTKASQQVVDSSPYPLISYHQCWYSRLCQTLCLWVLSSTLQNYSLVWKLKEIITSWYNMYKIKTSFSILGIIQTSSWDHFQSVFSLWNQDPFYWLGKFYFQLGSPNI